jgi:hypothetical protein
MAADAAARTAVTFSKLLTGGRITLVSKQI